VITIIPDVLQIRTSYPLLPWFGIISLGYACGYFLFKKDEAVRNKIMLNLGLFSLVIFVILRYFNFYGDSHLFIKENDFVQSLKSFLDVTKYPPSLLYFLLTIPFGLLILAGFKRESFLSKIITNYGRVPLFYYMLHLTLLPTVSYATLLLNNKFYQTDNIGVIWFLAFMIVIIAYPLVVWFIGFRKKYSKKFELLNYI
jgi:uncharacterized membrane protein